AVEAVIQAEADVGIMSYPPAAGALAIVPLRSEPMAFVCHPNHRLARRRVVVPADLVGETFVAFDAGLTIRKAIDRALRQHNVKVNTVMELDNIETIKHASIIAAGVSIRPRHTVQTQALRGALLNDTTAVLSPAEPICLAEVATVHEAVQTMLARRQAGVLVTDAMGRLTGIFTERDVLTRVVGKDLDARRTALAGV